MNLVILAALAFGGVEENPMVYGVRPTVAELYERDRWLRTTMGFREPVPPADGALVVEHNHDRVQQNAFLGGPIQVGGKVYYRGLVCHALSRIHVRLPGPGARFSAVAGVDTNPFTKGGKGTVVFSVLAGGQERFRSDVRKEGMESLALDIDLGNAHEFILAVEDGGDGIPCDVAAWAEARVVLEDGGSLWLGDMPVVEGQDGVGYGQGPPFSFVYGGTPSTECLGAWSRTTSEKNVQGAGTEHTVEYADPETGLQVRWVAMVYEAFPTVEWTVHLTNTGTADTPLLESIQGLDASVNRYPFPHPPMGEFTLHRMRGDSCGAASYELMSDLLEPGVEMEFAPVGGRPTNGEAPYYNLEWLSEGVIVVAGWPGQWAAHFTRDGEMGLRMRIGQERTHLVLHPGETIRTPRIVLQFWKGDRVHAQNVWRQWMMAHNMPRPGGELPPPQLLGSSYRIYHEMVNATEENQLLFINRYLEEEIPIDYWWMDAGWYENAHERGWHAVGTWDIDRNRFPNGLRPISDHAHANGIKTLLWFEPERVVSDTWLTENHPEWILGGEHGGLLDLGNPEALAWLTDHVDALMTQEGIDLYRQDFNMDPLDHWRNHDVENRQGMTEMGHVCGLLTYWDELQRRHPDALIDTCASGGRRNDLDSLRRAVPLWRSDYGYEPVGNQCQTYGLAQWAPYFGAGNLACGRAYYGEGPTPVVPYDFWSTCYPSMNSPADMRPEENQYAERRRLFALWRRIAPEFYGNFYPLTPHSQADDAWIGWQFDSPKRGTGFIQMFRRPASPFEVARWPLRGLDPTASYGLEDLMTGETWTATGDELMQEGVRVTIADRPGAAAIAYARSRKR